MMQYHRPELCHILCHICGTCGTHIKCATLCGTLGSFDKESCVYSITLDRASGRLRADPDRVDARRTGRVRGGPGGRTGGYGRAHAHINTNIQNRI